MMSSTITNITALIFFSILIVGLYYEWIKGGLEWE
jgi:NADH:ubiquinone oxidoreductase subunit 3 (subunit A)